MKYQREPAAAPSLGFGPARAVTPKSATTTRARIDGAVRLGDTIIVRGWAADEARLQFFADGHARDGTLLRYEREDVRVALSLPASSSPPGFLLIVAATEPTTDAVLRIETGPKDAPRIAFLTVDLMDEDIEPALELPLDTLAALLDAGWDDPTVRAVVLPRVPAQATRACLGHLEVTIGLNEHGGFVAGWIVAPKRAQLVLMDDFGNSLALVDASRFDRTDIHQAFGGEFGSKCVEAGFVQRWPHPASPGSRLRLLARVDGAIYFLHDGSWARGTADPVALARTIFGVPCPQDRLLDRISRHDAPLIESLQSVRARTLEELPTERWQFGPAPKAPRVSVIVPLYARWDFVEHQLVEFARDPFFEEEAELIYVVDDPNLLTPLKSHAATLNKLYGRSFSVVWGHVNRGYSGANNLGASYARGEHLCFLNSDAFPNESGWLQQLIDALENNKGFGAVGPRLLFPDGGIQHAGMAYEFDPAHGVHLNKHPLLGLDPAFDRTTGLAERAGITGACMVMRKDVFENVGRFDTGFLIGDFEDSELCLRIRSHGYKIGYLPTVELTHLERQSMRSIGEDGFRSQVVLLNAHRQERLWGHLLSSTSESSNANQVRS